jgi:hypothetical protein
LGFPCDVKKKATFFSQILEKSVEFRQQVVVLNDAFLIFHRLGWEMPASKVAIFYYEMFYPRKNGKANWNHYN